MGVSLVLNISEISNIFICYFIKTDILICRNGKVDNYQEERET